MARQLSISRLAAADLLSARLWLTQPGSSARAWTRLVDIGHAIRSLRADPVRWPVGDHPGLREIPVSGYRVLYRVEPDTGVRTTAGDVVIVRVFGPFQDRRML